MQNRALIPGNGTTRIASLVPLQGVGQHSGERTDTEVVRCKRTEYQTAAHGKAMEVTRYVDSSHRHLLLREIVTRRVVDIPTAT